MKKELSMPNFVEMENDILKFWEENDCFNKMREQNRKTGKYFPFLDGPITANNEMKLHHVWNRALKDIMLKYKSMNGYDSCYQNGFDAQGLWVEVNVEKDLGLSDKRDILKFGSARTGARGYIAFSSYLKIPVVMGSRCTNLKSGIGGFKGRKLQEGDFILFRIKRRYLPFFLSRTLTPDDYSQDTVTLRVVMGPQDSKFTKQGIETFLNEEYEVTSEFDRMGCRLEGPFIASKEGSDIISDGIALGSVQVPSHGKPIILLMDRQTTGGYAKIATVISTDIPKIAQRKTDHKIRFQAISVEEAQKLYIKELDELDQMRKKIHQPCKETLECRLVSKRIRALFED